MTIAELEQSLSALNIWRLVLLVIVAIAAVGTAGIQLQYNRRDEQLRAERAAENLRQREKIATIENDTAKALALLAWRRLNEQQFKIVSDGLKAKRIERLHIAALTDDPEANQF